MNNNNQYTYQQPQYGKLIVKVEPDYCLVDVPLNKKVGEPDYIEAYKEYE